MTNVNLPSIILSPQQMMMAERLTYAKNVSGQQLMTNAGQAVTAVITEYQPDPEATDVCILCGPGNNGGDGFVVASELDAKGYNVTVLLFGRQRHELKGDAAIAAAKWTGDCLRADSTTYKKWLEDSSNGLIVDAIFGTGLGKDITGELADLIAMINDSDLPVFAVDLPSGINGDNGLVCGTAIKADHTVTFACLKTGHTLLPGKLFCGHTHVKDIGIPQTIITEATTRATDGKQHLNSPQVWAMPNTPPINHNKYHRGHTVVVSGALIHGGAARLAARAALRAGSGLVTIAAPESALVAHASQLNAIMLARIDNEQQLRQLLADHRKNIVVIGPALGVGDHSRDMVTAVLECYNKTVIVDADGLTSFADDPKRLFALINKARQRYNTKIIITPHYGEFARLFPDLSNVITSKGKLVACRNAAATSNAVVCCKGSDTIICDLDGDALINYNAPSVLATAGSGDVLCGIIAAMAAQGMTPFMAAAAGVWLHSEAANEFGYGLIAEDLPETLPEVLTRLYENPKAC